MPEQTLFSDQDGQANKRVGIAI